MRREVLSILRCPECGAALELHVYRKSDEDPEEVTDGEIVCTARHRYAVWRGVPRMLPPEVGMPEEFRHAYEVDAPRERSGARAGRVEDFSFSHEWAMYRPGGLTWEQELPDRIAYLAFYIDQPRDRLGGLAILDAGCGNGTLTAAMAACGATVVGMDYSTSVEMGERQKAQFAGTRSRHVQYVQGDVRRPPFAPGTFDVVYSDGVLHHTDNTKTSFVALAPLVKPGGRLFVWLYRSDLKGIYRLKEATIAAMRPWLHPLPVRVLKALCFLGAVVLSAFNAARHLFGFRRRRMIPLWLKTLNLFDTFSPKYNHAHTPDEVKGWFRELGFTGVEERTIPRLGDTGFGMLGWRPRAHAADGSADAHAAGR